MEVCANYSQYGINRHPIIRILSTVYNGGNVLFPLREDDNKALNIIQTAPVTAIQAIVPGVFIIVTSHQTSLFVLEVT